MTPVLDFAGRPAVEAGDLLQAAPPTAEALRAIDLAAYGFDRAIDHQFWEATSSRANLWLRDGEPCAYSYRGLFGIGPVAGADPASAAEALRGELAASTAEEIRVDMPGSASALVQVALAAGLCLADHGRILLLSPPEPAPTAYAIHSYWLL